MSLIKRFSNKIKRGLNKIKLYKEIIFRELEYRSSLKIHFIRRPLFYIEKKIKALNVITRDNLLNQKGKYRTQYFGTEETVTFKDFYTVGELPESLQKLLPNFSPVTFERPFTCEVDNVELLGPTAIGFEDGRNLILETTVPQFHDSYISLLQGIPARTLAKKIFSKSQPSQLDASFSLVHAWSGNYYHWTVDTLTRLEGLEHHRERTGLQPVLIIDANPTAWQIESLKLLGYEPEKCIRWNGSSLQVKHLVISSFRRLTVNKNFYGGVSPQACRWISQRVVNNLLISEGNKPSFSSKVWISRRKSLVRKIVNEDDVIACLAPLGFVAYILEEMSFSEQVLLFSQAEMVVAPHGAGLTNMIYSQNLKVIELFGSLVHLDYLLLANRLGFQYGFLMNQAPAGEIRREDGDIIVDITKLREVLSMIQEF